MLMIYINLKKTKLIIILLPLFFNSYFIIFKIFEFFNNIRKNVMKKINTNLINL